MLKYVNTEVTFLEFPEEISLCINISNCPCQCEGCHSSYLANDIGDPLTTESLHKLITSNEGISCVGFMGGDSEPSYVNTLAKYVKENTKLKVGWYSGRQELSKDINLRWFDYIKLGPYIEKLGGLQSSTTNQCFYKVINNTILLDITKDFFKNAN